jgi:hypothetical protein
MTLAGWQDALAALVVDGSTPLDGLSPRESEWLQSLALSPGYRVTREVQRWWREFRVQLAAPLTLAALAPDLRARLIAEYIERNRRPSSFFVREALPFLDLCLAQASQVPHVSALATFERAMLVVGEAISSGALITVRAIPDKPLRAHALAAVACFSAPPHLVLAAAARKSRLPEATSTDHWLLIAPGLPNLARACTGVEAYALRTAQTTPIQPTSPGVPELWSAGALRECQ